LKAFQARTDHGIFEILAIVDREAGTLKRLN
jgi:hypothetical protein